MDPRNASGITDEWWSEIFHGRIPILMRGCRPRRPIHISMRQERLAAGCVGRILQLIYDNESHGVYLKFCTGRRSISVRMSREGQNKGRGRGGLIYIHGLNPEVDVRAQSRQSWKVMILHVIWIHWTDRIQFGNQNASQI